jgi:hypothetical protein
MVEAEPGQFPCTSRGISLGGGHVSTWNAQTVRRVNGTNTRSRHLCNWALLQKPQVAELLKNCPILWKPKVRYRVHKSPPLVPTLSQMIPVHIAPSCLPRIHFNLIVSHISWSSKSSLLAFSSKSYMNSSSFHTCYMPCPCHPWLDYSNYTWRRVQVTTLLIIQFSPVTSSLIGPDILSARLSGICV